MLERTRRFGSLDIGRWLAAVAVVLFHCSAFLGHKPFGGFLKNGYHGVDYFFVLSGFVIAHAHLGHLGDPSQFKNYAIKRFLRIYPPYWIATLGTMAIALVYPFHQPLNAVNITTNLLLIPKSSVDYPFVLPAWTLFYEVLFYVFLGILILVPRVLAVALLLAWPVAIYLFGVEVLQGTFPFSFLMNRLTLEFFWGIIACVLSPHLGRLSAWGILTAGLVVLAVAVTLETAPDALPAWANRLPNLARYGGSCAAIIAASVALERCYGSVRSRITDHLGNVTYSTYLVHYTTLMVIANSGVLARLAPNTPWLACFILLVLCLVAGSVFFEALERPTVAAFRSLLRLAGASASLPDRRLAGGDVEHRRPGFQGVAGNVSAESGDRARP